MNKIKNNYDVMNLVTSTCLGKRNIGRYGNF